MILQLTVELHEGRKLHIHPWKFRFHRPLYLNSFIIIPPLSAKKYFLSPFHLPRYRCPSTFNECVSLIILKHRSWCWSFCYRGNGHRNKSLTDFFSCWRRSSSSTIVKCVIFAGISHDFFSIIAGVPQHLFSSSRNFHGIRGGGAVPIPVQLSGYSSQLSILCEMLSSATCSRNALTQTIHKDDPDRTLKSWLITHYVLHGWEYLSNRPKFLCSWNDSACIITLC